MSTETQDSAYTCVIDGCPWRLVTGRTDLPDGRVVAPPGDMLIEAVAASYARGVERELRLHLESHDLTEYVATIVRLRAQPATPAAVTEEDR